MIKSKSLPPNLLTRICYGVAQTKLFRHCFENIIMIFQGDFLAMATFFI